MPGDVVVNAAELFNTKAWGPNNALPEGSAITILSVFNPASSTYSCLTPAGTTCDIYWKYLSTLKADES